MPTVTGQGCISGGEEEIGARIAGLHCAQRTGAVVVVSRLPGAGAGSGPLIPARGLMIDAVTAA